MKEPISCFIAALMTERRLRNPKPPTEPLPTDAPECPDGISHATTATDAWFKWLEGYCHAAFDKQAVALISSALKLERLVVEEGDTFVGQIGQTQRATDGCIGVLASKYGVPMAVPKRRGRPPGSKNSAAPKRRGRPPGSKNKKPRRVGTERGGE